MDSTALSLCMENELPIVVFDVASPNGIVDAARGAEIGTRVGVDGVGARPGRRIAQTMHVRHGAGHAMRYDEPVWRSRHAMIDGVLNDAEHRMQSAVTALDRDLDTVRTGRARPALVETLKVEYYGTPTPLNQMAAINAPEPRLITIQPWDKAPARHHRKGDPEVGPRPDAHERRQHHPPRRPAAHRGSPQGTREDRAQEGRRTRASPSATSAATPSTSCARRSTTSRSPTTMSAARRRGCRRSPTSTSPRSTSTARRRKQELLEV